MSKTAKPEIHTHIYPIIASDTDRLAHSGVPKAVNQSSYTKQLSIDLQRSLASEGKCIATLDNEILDEVRASVLGNLVAGSYDISQTTGVQQQSIGGGAEGPAGGKAWVGMKCAPGLNNSAIWKIKVKLQKIGNPTGTLYVRVHQPAGTIKDTIGSIDVSTISGTATWYEFTNSYPRYELPNGYYVFLEYDNGDASNYIRTFYRNADVESFSFFCTGTPPVSTQEYSSYDFMFEIMFIPNGIAKIYKNGSPIGSEFDTRMDSNDFLDLVLSDDLGPFNADDHVELWAYVDNVTYNPAGSGNHTMSLTEFKLKYDWDSTKIKGAATYS